MSSAWQPLRSLPPVAQPEGMRAAVLVPLWEDAGELRVILTRRPDGMRTHGGDVVFPGGRIDPDDDGAIAAAKREAWEEIGLTPDAVEVIGGLRPVSPRDPAMVMVPVVARVVRPLQLHPAPDEVDAIIEPTITDLLDDERWVDQDWGGLTMWFYEFPEGILWGATAFILRDLLRYFR